MRSVDLNSDLGESFGAWTLGDDEAMLDVVTSANVACGFHAGDPSTLRAVCLGAVARGVAIGAQVSYPDLVGFGRRFVDMAADELRDAVVYQIGALDAFARVAGAQVTYVKPHGALYHAAIDDDDTAQAIVDAVAEVAGDLAVLGSPGSALLRSAERAGIRTVNEVFADRAYRPDGRLVSRREAGAVITDPDLVAARVRAMVVDGVIEAVDGTHLDFEIGSICVHGDTPGAVSIALAARAALLEAGATITPFAPHDSAAR